MLRLSANLCVEILGRWQLSTHIFVANLPAVLKKVRRLWLCLAWAMMLSLHGINTTSVASNG